MTTSLVELVATHAASVLAGQMAEEFGLPPSRAYGAAALRHAMRILRDAGVTDIDEILNAVQALWLIERGWDAKP